MIQPLSGAFVVHLGVVALVAGCNRNVGHSNSDAMPTQAVEPSGLAAANGTGADAFAERLRAAGKAMAALEAEVCSMEPDAAIDMLRPLLDDEDPDVAEHAADLLLALEWPEADRVVVLDALGRTGDGRGRLASTGGRRIDAMGRRGLLTLILLYGDEGAPGEKLPPELGKGCELTMDLLGLVDWPDVRRVILRCLTWEDVDTAETVGRTLAWRDPGAECPRFSQMLRSEKPLERVAALAGLRACEDARAVPALLAVLADETSLARLSRRPFYGVRGPCDRPPFSHTPCPVDPATIGEYAARVIDNLTERELHGDAAAIDAWIGANLPPADNPTWMPRPLGPVGFWRDPRPIDLRDARRGEGDGCTVAASFAVDLRGDGTRYRVEWRKCEEEAWSPTELGLPETGESMEAPDYVTFTAPGATEPSLAFSTLVPASHEVGNQIDPDGYFLGPIVVALRGGSERQVLVARGYGGNSGFVDWCFVGAVGDGIGCWSQPDLDATAERSVGPGELAGFRDWQIRGVPGTEGPRMLRGGELVGDDEPQASERRLTIEIDIYDTERDPMCCPSRGSFVAELTAHPTEPRLVLESFERRSAAETAADSDEGGAE